MIEYRGTPEQAMRTLSLMGTYDMAVALLAVNGTSAAMHYHLEADDVASDIDVMIIADLFGKEPGEVGHDVVTMRKRRDKAMLPRVRSVARVRRAAR